jgi:hypothetical protein
MTRKKSGADYTVLVPTYNRPQFLERLLRYFIHVRVQAPVLVADGSGDDGRKENDSVIARHRGAGLDVHHFVPGADPMLVSAGDCKFGYMPRLDLAMAEITTPFVHLLCDDCFASPEFFAAAAQVLRTDPQVSTVIGQLWTLTLDPTRQYTATYGKVQEMRLAGSGGTRVGKSALDRLIANANAPTMNILWAMHRRDHLAAFFKAGRAATRAVAENAEHLGLPTQAEEWALDYWHGIMINVFAMIRGNVQHVPHLMLGHQYHADNWGLQLSRGPRLNEAIMRPYWGLMAEPYVDATSSLLAASEGVSKEAARSAVLYGMWHDMARRISHIADLRLRELPKSEIRLKSKDRHSGLKRIPGARVAAHAVLAQFQKYRRTKKLREDRALMEAPEMRTLREFIERDPNADSSLA